MTDESSSALLWDINTASQRLGLSKGHLYRMVAAKEVSFVRVGRRVMFSPATLTAWIESREVPAAKR